jgi:choline dehydrogenase-like flavoprotein
LLNTAIFFRPPGRAHPVFRSEAERAAQALVAGLQRGPLLQGAWPRLLRSARGADRLALAAWLALGFGAGRRLALRAFTEPVADPRNRVELSAGTDPLGRRLVRVTWTPGELERRSLTRAHELLDQSLRSAGLGRLELDQWPAGEWHPSLGGACHHMGTTRMHRDPARGVVDEHCRVHGVANLYVAGSSVFPAAGYANPVLTIVALALRLADRLHGLLAADLVSS